MKPVLSIRWLLCLAASRLPTPRLRAAHWPRKSSVRGMVAVVCMRR